MKKATEELEIIGGPNKSENDTNSSLWSCLEKFYLIVCYYTLAFFLIFGFIIFLYCFKYPVFWLFLVFYIGWLYYYRDTPHNRGRKFDWLGKCKFWNVGRDYFQVSLVKTAELPPDKNYLFAAFPHGFLPLGVVHNILTNSNSFDKVYPGLNVHIATLNMNYNVPIGREIMLALVGKPIKLPKVEDPSEELINEYHQKFILQLMELFDKYKGKYDVSGINAKLVIE